MLGLFSSSDATQQKEMTTMSNQTPSRLGQINATGDDRALFLKIYGGEVLYQFE